MPAKKPTQKIKKSTAKRTKTKSAKKTVKKKKPSAKARKTVKKPKTRKKPATKSAVRASKKKSEERKDEDKLFILSADKKKTPVKAKLPVKQELPVIDLEKLAASKAKSVALIKEPEKHLVAVSSRVSFYLGIFFGAVVVNVFIVSLIAMFSL